MFSRLKSLGSEIVPRLQAWTSDRSPDQVEGERLLEEGAYTQAEIHLAKALVEGEKRRQPPHIRIELRLLLSRAQRQQYDADPDHPNPAKLAAAQETALSALELARRSAAKELEIECLDELAAVLADSGQFDEVEARIEQAATL